MFKCWKVSELFATNKYSLSFQRQFFKWNADDLAKDAMGEFADTVSQENLNMAKEAMGGFQGASFGDEVAFGALVQALFHANQEALQTKSRQTPNRIKATIHDGRRRDPGIDDPTTGCRPKVFVQWMECSDRRCSNRELPLPGRPHQEQTQQCTGIFAGIFRTSVSHPALVENCSMEPLSVVPNWSLLRKSVAFCWVQVYLSMAFPASNEEPLSFPTHYGICLFR